MSSSRDECEAHTLVQVELASSSAVEQVRTSTVLPSLSTVERSVLVNSNPMQWTCSSPILAVFSSRVDANEARVRAVRSRRGEMRQHYFKQRESTKSNKGKPQCIRPTSSTIPINSSLVISIFSNSDAPASTLSISSFDNSENFSMKVPSMNPVAGVGAVVVMAESRGDFGARKLDDLRRQRGKEIRELGTYSS